MIPLYYIVVENNNITMFGLRKVKLKVKTIIKIYICLCNCIIQLIIVKY